ncbi:MAG: hypothetical protein IJM58_09620, partial [Muribaculaceae bacterium]|nr:hypothetical protein [Muribaculaceae bacterium]
MQRSELVAIDAAALGIEAGQGVIVRDVSNIERPTQWTYDGKLLMEATYIAQNMGKAAPTYEADALEALKQYQWTGNIRELHNIV